MDSPLRLGRFTLSEPLAQGASGIVYRAKDDAGDDVAVKVLLGVEPKMAMLFEQEVRTAMVLDHPHIVPVLGAGQCLTDGPNWHAGSPWLAMPFCPGGTVGHHPPTSWEGLRNLLVQLLDALAHAHARGILHRDVKAANLLLAQDGSILLGDFGLSRSLADAASTKPVRGGTPGYVAPEQGQGRWWQEGPHTDLYAVGVLAWRLVAGDLPEMEDPVLPSDTTDPLRRNRKPLPGFETPAFEVPSGLLSWCRRMAAPETRNRFELAADALKALSDLDGTPRTFTGSGARPLRGMIGTDVRVPLIGRSVERRLLQQRLAEACAGHTRVVVMRGPIGMGTSSLARWLCETAHAAGAAWPVILRHDAHGRSPRFGVEGALRHALGLVRARPEDASLRGVGPEAVELVWPRKHVAGPERRQQIQQALRSESRPTLLWIDDAQWGLEALRLAVSWQASAEPALIVVTLDPSDVEPEVFDELAALCSMAGVEQIDVGPMTPSEMGELLDHTVRIEPLSRLAIVEHVAGHPLYATQWLHDALRRGHLIPGPQGHQLDRSDRLDQAPDLKGLWSLRLAEILGELTLADRASVSIAAVVGLEVERQLWIEACKAAGLVPSDEALVQLQRQELISADKEGIRFVHPILRDALVGSLSNMQRLAFAQAGASALASLGVETSERRAALLLQAGQVEPAFDTMAEAAQHWGFVDFERASAVVAQWQALCDTHLPADDPRTLRPGMARARLAYLQNDGEGLAAEAARFRGFARRTGDAMAHMQAARTASRLAGLHGDLKGSVSHLAAALKHCEDPSYEDIIRTELCDSYNDLGQPKLALQFVEDPPQSDDPHDIVHYLLTRSRIQAEADQPREALLTIESLQAQVLGLDNRVQLAQWHGCRAVALQEMGHLGAALADLEKVIEIRESAGFPVELTKAHTAGLLLQLGRADDTTAMLQGLPSTTLVRAVSLAALAIQQDLDPVRNQIDDLILQMASELAQPRTAIRAFERIGDEAAALGDTELAQKAWRAAREGWGQRGSQRRADRIYLKMSG